MNSLTYLSRQFDVLASSSSQTTSPAADTGQEGATPPMLKRTQTWSTRTLLIPSPRQAHSRSRKRSHSTPANARPSTPPLQNPLGSAPSAMTIQSKSKEQSFVRRIYLVRVFMLLSGWLSAVWRSLRKRGFTWTGHVGEEAENTGDEKESDDEGKRDIEPMIAAPATTSLLPSVPLTPPPRTALHSVLPSPLSQSAALPTVNVTPPESLESFYNPPSQTNIQSSALASSSSSTSSQPGIPASSSSGPSAPKTPFHLPKTLVLDLDETLIHSTTRPLFPSGSTGLLGLGGFGLGRKGKGAGHMVEVVLGGRSTLYHVYKRPFADYFLRKVSGWYTLVIFTASMQEYADPVIDWLDAGRGILARRFFRESCTQLPNGSYTKDLSIIEQDLSRVCLIDNSPVSYSVNQANGIPIEGWTHDLADEALLDLLPVLDSLRFTGDVRRVLGIRGFS